jgi:hypothetical protein
MLTIFFFTIDTYHKQMTLDFTERQVFLLVLSQNASLILQNVRNRYRSPNSYLAAVCKIKKHFIATNVRHESFRDGIQSVLQNSECNDGTIRQEVESYAAWPTRDQVAFTRTWSANAHVVTTCPSSSATVNGMLKQVQVLPDYMAHFKPTENELAESKTRRRDSLRKKSTTCITVPSPDTLIEFARNCLQQEDAFGVLIGIALVTGRRFSELLVSGVFTKRPNATYQCKFDGQLKKRVAVSYEIPLLVPVDEVLEAIDRTRKALCTSKMTMEEVQRKYCKKANVITKKVMRDFLRLSDVRITFHSLRSIYGCVSFHKFRHTASLNHWLYKALGHEDLTESIHYSSVRVLHVDDCEKLELVDGMVDDV